MSTEDWMGLLFCLTVVSAVGVIWLFCKFVDWLADLDHWP